MVARVQRGRNEIVVGLVTRDGRGADVAEELRREGHEPIQACSPAELVRQLDERRPELCVVDDALPNLDEEGWVERFKASYDACCVLLVDEYAPRTLARVLNLGADALVKREVQGGELLRVIRQELRAPPPPPEKKGRRPPVPQMVGPSPQMHQVCRLIAISAPSDAPVLITGESGTGKELVARAIHRLSPRRQGPYIVINCGAIPENLLESELFGHEKGAFTGADSARRGRFEQAHGGTLVLDEIGELAPALQVKLLRVLQEQRFERVGGSETIEVDVRIVAATHRDLQAVEGAEPFRSDLYYRLNVLRIDVPPLRRRRMDVGPLWRHFLDRAARKEGREPYETHPDVLRMLSRHDWPGNVRELENLARRVVTLRADREITPHSFPAFFDEGEDANGPDVSLVGMSLEEIERIAILQTYQAVGSVRRTAEMLGISERTMYYRLKEYRKEGSLDFDTDELDVVGD